MQADELLGESSQPSIHPSNLPTMISREGVSTVASSYTLEPDEVDWCLGGGSTTGAEPGCCIIEGMSLLHVS